MAVVEVQEIILLVILLLLGLQLVIVLAEYPDPDAHYLVFLSGGFDSTAALLKIFLDNPKAMVTCCHLVLRNNENRWQPERDACHKIQKWFHSKGYVFRYQESIAEFTSQPFGTDSEWVGFYAGLYARSEEYRYIVDGRSGTDDYFNSQYRDTMLMNVYNTMVFNGSLPQPPLTTTSWYYPLIHTTKHEALEMLKNNGFPLEICFTCRNPIKNYYPCGECKSCKDIEKILGNDGILS
jgi:7-cyano-7-deazaguanine synthase in queuosine biosynthesis